MSEHKSYVTNCFIKARSDEKEPYLFRHDGNTMPGLMEVRLDRYAIIPIEEYEALTGENVQYASLLSRTHNTGGRDE